MKISEIQYIPTKAKNGHFGFVSFILDDSFFVGSLAVYSRLDGNIRLVWPNINNKGVQYPILYPINKECSDYIENIIFDEIKKLLPI